MESINELAVRNVGVNTDWLVHLLATCQESFAHFGKSNYKAGCKMSKLFEVEMKTKDGKDFFILVMLVLFIESLWFCMHKTWWCFNSNGFPYTYIAHPITQFVIVLNWFIFWWVFDVHTTLLCNWIRPTVGCRRFSRSELVVGTSRVPCLLHHLDITSQWPDSRNHWI